MYIWYQTPETHAPQLPDRSYEDYEDDSTQGYKIPTCLLVSWVPNIMLNHSLL